MTSAPWHPRSEAELLAMIDAGLEETHQREMKCAIEDTKANRKELARDLAQFAIDGGVLIVGVREDKESRAWTPAPQPLAGLPERIEQIARSSIDPLLSITVIPLPSVADPAYGYVVVLVRPSVRAPHMVDGVYYGRGDTTRVRLSDAEVVRYHAARAVRGERIDALLNEEEERDPFKPRTELGSPPEFGHLYLVAQPEIDEEDRALALVRGDESLAALRSIVRYRAEENVPSRIRGCEPVPGSASTWASRAAGVAFCSQSLREGRASQPSGPGEGSAIDIEIREDAGIRIFAGRMTDQWTDRRNPPINAILDVLAVGYALRIVHWAQMLSEETSYRSGWHFGISANGLRGLKSISWIEGLRGEGPTYDRDTYRRTTSAPAHELLENPRGVASRLVGPLLRALETSQRHPEVTSITKTDIFG